MALQRHAPRIECGVCAAAHRRAAAARVPRLPALDISRGGGACPSPSSTPPRCNVLDGVCAHAHPLARCIFFGRGAGVQRTVGARPRRAGARLCRGPRAGHSRADSLIGAQRRRQCEKSRAARELSSRVFRVAAFRSPPAELLGGGARGGGAIPPPPRTRCEQGQSTEEMALSIGRRFLTKVELRACARSA